MLHLESILVSSPSTGWKQIWLSAWAVELTWLDHCASAIIYRLCDMGRLCEHLDLVSASVTGRLMIVPVIDLAITVLECQLAPPTLFFLISLKKSMTTSTFLFQWMDLTIVFQYHKKNGVAFAWNQVTFILWLKDNCHLSNMNSFQTGMLTPFFNFLLYISVKLCCFLLDRVCLYYFRTEFDLLALYI